MKSSRTEPARRLAAAMLVASASLITTPLGAQTTAPSAHASSPEASAAPLRGRIAVDGVLDEAAWASATPITSFRQIDPEEGKPASEATEVRILYDADALYIGAWMRDSRPVTSRLLRRDAIVLDSDWLSISLDSYHDHLTAFRFSVNPAGVRRDEVFSSGGRSGGVGVGSSTGGSIVERGGVVDQSWDPVWAAATTVTDSGWVAEMRIPFSQLRFSREEVQTWGLQLERRIARRQEQAVFAFTPKDQATGVGTFGHLTGLREVRASQRLEVLPYASGRVLYRPLAVGGAADFPNPYLSRANLGGGMGADVKYRLSSNLTLDATLNPDFGQVELDPAVVNLTAFETKFDEKRPFFVEGAEIMRFGTSALGAPEGGPPQLMYSRRVGRAPQLGLPSDAVYADLPDVTTILGAAKLTGRAAGGWSVGIVEGVTQREEASFVDAQQTRGGAVVEPLTNYFAGRLKRDVRGGRTTIGALVTAVNRRLEGGSAAAQLREGAYAGGLDFRAETADRAWSAFGTFSSSYVTGTPEAIAATQRSSARYFQRPDARRLTYDPAATSLAGYRAQIDAGKRAGSWLWNVALTASSPGYEINDLGYLTLTDRLALDPNLNYERNRPGRSFRRWMVRFGPDFVWNYDGDLTRQQTYLSFQSQLHNYWQVNLQVNHSEPVMNDRLTRGGPLTLSPAADAARLEIVSDPRRRYTVQSLMNVGTDRAGLEQRSLSLDVGFKPADNWVVRVGPALSHTKQPAQYVTTIRDPAATSTYGSRYIFAGLDQTTLGVDTRLNVTFTPALTLELYAQPFLSSNDFGALKELRAPRTFDFDVYGRDVGTAEPAPGGKILVDPDGSGPAPAFRVSDQDFNLASLRGNAVLRWEWRPGSTFFLVWQQERSERLAALDAQASGRGVGSFDFGRNVQDLFDVRPVNVLLFKVSYWLNP